MTSRPASYLPAPKWGSVSYEQVIHSRKGSGGQRKQGMLCSNKRPQRKEVKRQRVPSCAGRVSFQSLSIFCLSRKLLSHSTSPRILVHLFSNYYVPCATKVRNLGARFCASFGHQLRTGYLREDFQHADLPPPCSCLWGGCCSWFGPFSKATSSVLSESWQVIGRVHTLEHRDLGS